MQFKKEEIKQAVELWAAERAKNRIDGSGLTGEQENLLNQAQRLDALIKEIKAQIQVLQRHLAPLEEQTTLMLHELKRLQALLKEALQQSRTLQEKLAHC
jgi:predicted nuclease with TOPRIM domain